MVLDGSGIKIAEGSEVMEFEPQSCLRCGRMHTRGREFCSDYCRNKYWRENHRTPADRAWGRRCQYIGCDQPLRDSMRPEARYCSAACRQSAYRQRTEVDAGSHAQPETAAQ